MRLHDIIITYKKIISSAKQNFLKLFLIYNYENLFYIYLTCDTINKKGEDYVIRY